MRASARTAATGMAPPRSMPGNPKIRYATAGQVGEPFEGKASTANGRAAAGS